MTRLRPLVREADRLISMTDVADRLGIAKQTLSTWVKEQRFPPPIQWGGRLRKWRQGDVESWIARRTATAASIAAAAEKAAKRRTRRGRQ